MHDRHCIFLLEQSSRADCENELSLFVRIVLKTPEQHQKASGAPLRELKHKYNFLYNGKFCPRGSNLW
jgi:hypothetical protein